MIDRRFWYPVLLAILGGAILLNPLFLYPDGGGEPEVTYRVQQIENESIAEQALGLSERVLECPSERPCKLEKTVLEEGAVEYDGHVQRGQSYPAVWIESGWYLPKNSRENGTAVLTLREVSSMEAVEHAAVPADEQSPEVRKAVESGSVTVYGERVEAFERRMIVEHDGEYYFRNGYRGVGSHWTGDGALTLVRAALFALGGGFLLYAGWRFRAATERVDR